jgi:hypothetical protein
MKPWGAGSHNHPVKAQFLYVLFDQLLARVRTHVGIGSGDSNSLKALCPFGHGLTIHGSGNV